VTPIYIHRPLRSRWCAVRRAHPGGLIITACRDAIGYTEVAISTDDPGELTCPACAIELRAEVQRQPRMPIYVVELLDEDLLATADHEALRDAVADDLRHLHIYVEDRCTTCGLVQR
jgi:hypothetical protein